MASRNLSLTERNEEVRDKQIVVPIVSFSLLEIKEHFDRSITALEDQFSVADTLAAEGKMDACKDIWRSQVVFAESALDFYIHELSQYGMMKIFTGSWAKTPKYNNFQIAMSAVEKGINNPETNSWLEEFLNERFSREVYLSHDSMRNQMNLLGLNLTNIFESAFPKNENDPKPYRTGAKIVTDLFSRRNQIAHQSDRLHANAEKNDITKQFVQQCIAEIQKLVECMHNEATSK